MGNLCSSVQPTEDAEQPERSTQLPRSTQASDAGILRPAVPQGRVANTAHRDSLPTLRGTTTTSPESCTTSSAQRTTAAPGLSPQGLLRSSGSEAATPRARSTSRTARTAAASAEAKPQQVSYKALMKETMDRIRANQAARRAAERAAPLGPVQFLGSVTNEASNSNLNQSSMNRAGGPALRVDYLPPEQQNCRCGENLDKVPCSAPSAERKKKKEARSTEELEYGGSNHRLSTNPFVPSDMAVRFSGSLSLSSNEKDSSSLSSGTDPLGRTSSGRMEAMRSTQRDARAPQRSNGSRSGSGYAFDRAGSVGSGRLEERPLGGDAFDTASWSSASSTRATPTMSRASSMCHE